jgi:phosphomevalonate kinase
MISGEYVVLDGAEALVAAVDVRAIAAFSGPRSDRSPEASGLSPGPQPVPPEAMLARSYAELELGPVPMELTIDTSALRSEDRKLGLGSSAAAAAATAAAVVGWHGLDVDTERRRILRWALDGHRAIAPQGSGADVAASTLGGLVRFQRDKAEDAFRIEWPTELLLEVVWTGKPARTSDLVAAVRALAEHEPERYQEASSRLREAAQRLMVSMIHNDASAALLAVAEHHHGMDELGRAAGVGIINESLEGAARLAREHGGAAKPSGAGGGDVALAFFAASDAAARFRASCSAAGLTPLRLAIDAEGARIDARE